MHCPKCSSEFNIPNERFVLREGKVYIVITCPKCSFLIKEIETRYGQVKRLLLIFFGIAFGVVIFIFLMTLIPLYYFMPLMLVVMTLVLILPRFLTLGNNASRVLFFLDEFKNEPLQKENKNIDTLDASKKANDLIMNKIVENVEKIEKISKTNNKKKIKFLSVIIVLSLLIFSLYPEILKIMSTFGKMKEFNYKFSSEARDSRGEQLADELNSYHKIFYKYPQDLNDEYILRSQGLLKDIRTDYEKDAIGKEIKLSDFVYKSTEHEFELCLQAKNYSKCWHGKNGVLN